MHIRCSIFVVAVLSAAIFACGCSAKKVSLLNKYEKGSVQKYKMVTDVDVKVKFDKDDAQLQPVKEKMEKLMSSKSEMVLSRTIDEVDKDGNADVTTVWESGTTTLAGNTNEISDKGKKVKMKVKPSGEPIGTSEENMFAFGSPLDPKGLNDTWQVNDEIVLPGVSKPIQIVFDYKLEKFLTVDGFKCAKIKFSSPKKEYKQDNVVLVMSTDGYVDFAYEKGNIVKMETNSNLSLKTEGQPYTMNSVMKLKMDLLK